MNAGELRFSAQIVQPVWADNEAGDRVVSADRVLGTRRCGLRPVSARERLRGSAGQEIAHLVTHIAKMRFTDLVQPDCRLIIQGKAYQIDGIIDVENRGRELQVLCHETT